MSYYADPDLYYEGTTAREAFERLERLESMIAIDRHRAEREREAEPAKRDEETKP